MTTTTISKPKTIPVFDWYKIDFSVEAAKKYILTPEAAADLLENHSPKHPRRIVRGKVNTIADDIKADMFFCNGETMILDTEGLQTDGRHRASAVVQTGKSIVTYIVTGVNPLTNGTVDVGSVRNLANVLQIGGNAEADADTAAVLKPIFLFEVRKINRLSVVNYGGRGGNSPKNLRGHTVVAGGSAVPSKQILRDYYMMTEENKKSVDEATAWARKLKKVFPHNVPVKVTGFLAYLALHDDPVLGIKFLESLVTGLELSKGDPAFALREKLNKHAMGGRMAAAQYTAASVLAWGIQAWDKYRTGDTLLVVNASIKPSMPAYSFKK